MANKYYGTVIASILLCLSVSLCEEASNETDPVQDYIQIFRGIPALFEYLLDVVEQRPEILEMDKITAFQDETETTKEDKKREVDFESLNKDYKGKPSMYNVENNNIAKRAIASAVSSDYTTELKEYGNNIELNNDNKDYKAKVKRQTVEKSNKDDNSKVKRKIKYVPKNIKNKAKHVVTKRNNNLADQFGDSILGSIDWSRFYLAPEEVEEYALKVEKAIEDNNNKHKDNK